MTTEKMKELFRSGAQDELLLDIYLDENKLVINDSWGTYVRAETVSQDDLEALCRAVGVEYAPKKQEE